MSLLTIIAVSVGLLANAYASYLIAKNLIALWRNQPPTARNVLEIALAIALATAFDFTIS